VRGEIVQEGEEQGIVIGPAAERDEAEGADGQAEDDGVARELRDMRAHRGQRALGVAVEQHADGLHVLALPPGHAAHKRAGLGARRLGLGDAPMDLIRARHADGSQGEAGIGGERVLESPVGAGQPPGGSDPRPRNTSPPRRRSWT
jgi:hypothetical protein